MRSSLQKIVEAPWFERMVLILIAINAVTLGMETSESLMQRFGPALKIIDSAILTVFVLEIIMRLIVRGWSFWRDPWRVFDFAVVSVALLPSGGSLSVLRAFRVLRVLRLISGVGAIRRVVTGLLAAIPGMGSVVLLLCLIFYVFSVMATKLFGEVFPQWFGTIGESAYSLFQIMTLESWSMGIVRPVMETYPYAWAFFVPFIITTSFAVLNLFIGIIVDAMQKEHEVEADASRQAVLSETEQILEEIKVLRGEVAGLKTQLAANK